MIGTTLGSYTIVGELGEGGMGVVYLAEHPLIGSKAVVKKLRPELCTNREVIDRFFNEARATSRIKHSGIVSIFDFGYAADGTAYLVMEALEGESLGRRLARLGGLPEDVILRLAKQIASALAAAHAVGIVHRDLKPDNVFIVADSVVEGGERVKILDFGIAKLVSNENEASISKTRTGVMMGSPLYMAPEQCRGAGEVDARADIYALGCVVYHAMCGRPPFVADGVGEIVAMHIYEPPRPPRALNSDVSPALERFILRCLEKDPARRFERMQDVEAEIDALRASPSSARSALGPTLVAVAVGSLPDVTLAPPALGTRPAANAPAAVAPTVAAGAAGVARARPRGRAWGWVIGAVVVGLGGAIALGVMTGGPEEAPAKVEAPVEAKAPAAAPVEAPAAAPVEAKAPVEVPDAAPVEAPTAAEPTTAPKHETRPRKPKEKKRWGKSLPLGG